MGIKEQRLTKKLRELKRDRIALEGRDKLRQQIAAERSRINKARYGVFARKEGIGTWLKRQGKDIKAGLDRAAKREKKFSKKHKGLF